MKPMLERTHLPWTRDQLLLVFNLYCRTPFGRLHRTNADVVTLAERLGRTPSAVAMKLSNFASFDPLLKARGIKGLPNAGAGERKVWDEFHADPERVAFESERAMENLEPTTSEPTEEETWTPLPTPRGPTERDATIRVRLVQTFFRRTVLTAYGNACAVCLIPERQLLTASHIIRWADDPRRRADPTNGLSLCTLHDRAFDRGLIGVDANRRLLISPLLRRQSDSVVFEQAFARLGGSELRLPERFEPDPAALALHRKSVFRA